MNGSCSWLRWQDNGRNGVLEYRSIGMRLVRGPFLVAFLGLRIPALHYSRPHLYPVRPVILSQSRRSQVSESIRLQIDCCDVWIRANVLDHECFLTSVVRINIRGGVPSFGAGYRSRLGVLARSDARRN